MKKTIQIILFFLLTITCVQAQGMAQGKAQDLQQDMPQGRRGVHRVEWGNRRTASTQYRGPGGDFYTGTKHQLTVLAEFADQPFSGNEAATLATWDQILNGVQMTDSPFVGSFHDYFDAQSYGAFNLICDLQYVQVGNRVRYRSTEADDENSQYLVMDIVDSLLHRNIDWSLYDWNGDGYVNQLLIIFAGKGSGYGGFGGGDNALWPHQWWLSEHFNGTGGYQQPRTVSYQGQNYIVDSYCAVQELSKYDTYSAFGTLCHEYTHCFGFPDFYSYSINTTPHKWELMDSGNYNGGGFCPAGYSSHERWLMGWLTPTELTNAVAVSGMPALEDEPVAYLIRNDGYASEYYMIENRQCKGWDAALPNEGVLIFHIDFVPELWSGSDMSVEVNASNAQHYMLFKPNNQENKSYCSGWSYPYATVNSLTDTSVPAAILWHANNNTYLMSKPLTGIAVTNGLASFTFLDTLTQVEQVSPESSAMSRKILRNGQLFIRQGEHLYNVLGQKTE